MYKKSEKHFHWRLFYSLTDLLSMFFNASVFNKILSEGVKLKIYRICHESTVEIKLY